MNARNLSHCSTGSAPTWRHKKIKCEHNDGAYMSPLGWSVWAFTEKASFFQTFHSHILTQQELCFLKCIGLRRENLPIERARWHWGWRQRQSASQQPDELCLKTTGRWSCHPAGSKSRSRWRKWTLRELYRTGDVWSRRASPPHRGQQWWSSTNYLSWYMPAQITLACAHEMIFNSLNV